MRPIIYPILIAIFLAASIVFLVLFIQSRKAYKKLLRKNLEEQESAFSFSEKIEYGEIRSEDAVEQDLIERLKVLLEVDKVYIDPNLTLNLLAKKMGTNRATLSHVVNQYFHKSFPALLNQYRVNEALRLLTDKGSKDYKLEVIGEMCGYRNRQVFHSAFKRETGITPNHFRKISAG